NLRVVGFLDEDGKDIGRSLVNPKIIGGFANVEQIVAQERIDRIILSLKERRGSTPIKELLNVKFGGVRIEDVHSCFERLHGRILRKTRLDEIPQLFNVLRGEMSLVGPRPERPYFCDQLEKEIPFYNLRHSIRPGLTGWAQVRFRYGASLDDAKGKLEFDLFYLKNMSLLVDCAILFETAKVVILGRGAQ